MPAVHRRATLSVSDAPPCPMRECLLTRSVFGPLTGIDVIGTRVEDSLLVVSARLTISVASVTVGEFDDKCGGFVWRAQAPFVS